MCYQGKKYIRKRRKKAMAKGKEKTAEGGDRGIKKLKRGFRWQWVPVAMERQQVRIEVSE